MNHDDERDPRDGDPRGTDPRGGGPVDAGPLPDPAADPLARALRDALAARADATQPADRLEEIRMSTTARRRATRAWTAVATTAAVVVVGGSAYALAGRDGEAVRTVASSPTSPAAASSSTAPAAPAPAPAAERASTTAAAPRPSATPTGASSATAPATAPASPDAAAPGTSAAGLPLPTGSASVPVYWLGGARSSLFREFVRAGGEGDDADRALAAMLAGEPSDPDYDSPWAPVTGGGVTREADRLVVDLPAGAAPGSLDPARAAAAVQQLVHTVTAAAGEDVPVEVREDGRAEPVLFGYAVPATVSRAPQAEVQAPAWITSVDTGTPGQVVVAGVGSAFEGTLLYTVTDASGAEVTRGPAQAGANGAFAEFSVTVPLPAGEYTVLVERPDESGGAAGEQPAGDTKTFTVR
ncbi:Gmad2 immunoglobulin-like domain-containing protein [Kineococcus sp. SYSU DK005]|uniref:Gmad2 immunoglobulin-like domain-containing protein n=1 Tax=Kineococcus sp. SYSU DK005 TaxID=3383126 RepID=UPI003D7CE9D3